METVLVVSVPTNILLVCVCVCIFGFVMRWMLKRFESEQDG